MIIRNFNLKVEPKLWEMCQKYDPTSLLISPPAHDGVLVIWFSRNHFRQQMVFWGGVGEKQAKKIKNQGKCLLFVCDCDLLVIHEGQTGWASRWGGGGDENKEVGGFGLQADGVQT